MNIITAYQTKNPCYQQGRAMTPVGIVVHSTGVNNPNLCRYVDDAEHCGVNRYGNHWNRPDAQTLVHGAIGLDKDGRVLVVNTLPYTFAAWGVGKGIAIGKVSERDGLEVAWPTYFEGDVSIDGTLSIGGVSLLDKVYPVGSIYLSISSANPSTLIGGTWVRWGSGRVPVGVNTADNDFSAAGKTGGSKTHKLTVEEMPSHYHASDGWAACDDGAGNYITLGGMPGGGTQYGTRYTGGDQPHNNMPPYITCYMWQRTA